LKQKKKRKKNNIFFLKKKNHLKEIRKVEIHPARCIVVWAVAQHRVMRGPARQKGTISSFFLFLLHQM